MNALQAKGESEARLMSDEPPLRDLFQPKVVAIILFTSIFLGVAVSIIVKVMGRWRYMPVVAVLVAAMGFLTLAYWINYRNWYLE